MAKKTTVPSGSITMKEFAQKLGVGTDRLAQIMTEIRKKKLTTITATKVVNTNYYSPAFVDTIQKMYKAGKFGIPRNRSKKAKAKSTTAPATSKPTNEKSPAKGLTIHINDDFVAKLLLKEFKSVNGIVDFLKQQLLK